MRKVINIIGLSCLVLIIVVNIFISGNKTIITSYKDYRESNNNLVLNKILSDNELKEEIPHMFNYTSNGYYNENDIDSNYITEGLYSREDEDGISYYYRGNIDNNNLQFSSYAEDYYVYTYESSTFQSLESCQQVYPDCNANNKKYLAMSGDKMYWKIIRVNGDGSLRLIYNGLDSSSESFYDKSLAFIGYIPYNLNHDDPKYTGYTYNRDTNETDSFIKKEVDTWYNNAIGNNPLYDNMVIEARFCNDSSGYNYDGNSFFAGYDRLGQIDTNFAKDNSPTLICPDTTENYGGSYRLKAGLMTADELVLAGYNMRIVGKNYLDIINNTTASSQNFNFWTMTPAYFDNPVNYYASGAWIFFTVRNLISSDNSLTPSTGLRPVINVSTENMILIGDGTEDNPYTLENINSYKENTTEKNNGYKEKITIKKGNKLDINKVFDKEIDLNDKITWISYDESIARIENGKILGLEEGTTTITGIDEDGTTYEIETTIIDEFLSINDIYIILGVVLIIIVITIYLCYKNKSKKINKK